MKSIVAYIKDEVDATEYWEWMYPDVSWPSSGSEARVSSGLRTDDDTPSLSINPETGAWYDHGIGKGGNSIVSHHAEAEGLTQKEAAVEIFHQFVHPVVDVKRTRSWTRALAKTPSIIRYIEGNRLITPAVREAMGLGYDGQRITLPVQNEYGLVTNVKKYDPDAKRKGVPKMLNHKDQKEERSFGSPPMLYPLQILQDIDEPEFIVITEGEWDALALLSIGVPAVSSTHGCKTWPSQYNDLLRGHNVVIAYDNDKDGEEYGMALVKQLMHTAKSIRRLKIPSNIGKDVSDWLLKKKVMRSYDAWSKRIDRLEVLVDNPAELVTGQETLQVPLDEASRAEYTNKPISVDALVTGKDTAPFILPKKVRTTCSRQCDDCPLAEKGVMFKDVTVDPMSPSTLELLNIPKHKIHKMMLNRAGISTAAKCKGSCQDIETFNVENVLLIPTIDSKAESYVTRSAFLCGHGIGTNKSYRFTGTTLPDPNDQKATHLFGAATPVQDQVDTFELTDELKRKLRKFQKPARRKMMTHLHRIAEWQARHVTKIKERPDLHIAVDLVFHSLPSLRFNGEDVSRAMLDVLVIGDTRCGKGYVTEGLVRYYRVGEVASGENCSFAGLVGGCESVGKRFIVKWGIIPLNNGRLVCIDEASALTEDDFGYMSRVRSEGVAEISKIVREQTRANTRLIWLSNPRSGRGLMSYNMGCLAIKELVGRNEDIARFDFAMSVATEEVAPDIINTEHNNSDLDDADLYPADLCRSLVMWAWSRQHEDVQFTDTATKAIINAAIQLGKQYDPTIPLIQAENIRVKLAKLSAAVAARVFSTDDSCTKVIIDEDHVRCAVDLLNMFYTKASMGYDVYSTMMKRRSEEVDEARLSSKFNELGDNASSCIKGLAQVQRVNAHALADYLGGDILSAKTLISELVKLGALMRHERGDWYIKNPKFNAWVRSRQKELVNDR